MRVAEIVSDFRNLQHYISSIQINPPASDFYEEGYVVLRHCATEAHALLAQPFRFETPNPEGNQDQEEVQLRRVILDASLRRFKAQSIYLRASAALRWVNSRTAILGGHSPQQIHTPALQLILNTLRAELASVTTERVELSLRSLDISHGKWLQEDPSLEIIQHMLRSGH